MISSPKLTNLKQDFESKKVFFKYKADRFEKILQKEFEAKFDSKLDTNFIVNLKMNNSQNGYLPILIIALDDSNHEIKIERDYQMSGGVNITSIDKPLELDRAFIVGMLAYEMKTDGKTYEKIEKYFELLEKISDEIKDLDNKILEEKAFLQKEKKRQKVELLAETIGNGTEFILNSGEINNRRFRDRGGLFSEKGVLLRVLNKEKQSFNIQIEGRKKTARHRWDNSDETYEYKIGKNRLIEILIDKMKKGSNPEFDRELTIFALMED